MRGPLNIPRPRAGPSAARPGRLVRGRTRVRRPVRRGGVHRAADACGRHRRSTPTSRAAPRRYGRRPEDIVILPGIMRGHRRHRGRGAGERRPSSTRSSRPSTASTSSRGCSSTTCRGTRSTARCRRSPAEGDDRGQQEPLDAGDANWPRARASPSASSSSGWPADAATASSPARPNRSPTRSSCGSRPARPTGSTSCRRTCRAASRTSSSTSSRCCNAADCSAPTTPARTLREHYGLARPPPPSTNREGARSMTAPPTASTSASCPAGLGAEIVGVDLTRRLDAETVALRPTPCSSTRCWASAASTSTTTRSSAFAAHFGELTTAHPTVASVAGQPERAARRQRAAAGRTTGTPTSPSSRPAARSRRCAASPSRPTVANTCSPTPRPPTVTCPRCCGNFADTLWAVHTNDYDYAGPHLAKRTTRSGEPSSPRSSSGPRTRSSACTRRPASGPVHRRVRAAAVGLSNTESRDILRLLQAYVTRPENTVRVAVGAGRRRAVGQPHHPALRARRLRRSAAAAHRVTVAGDVPVGVDGRRSSSLIGDASHYSPA